MTEKKRRKIFIIINKFAGHKRKHTNEVYQMVSGLQSANLELEYAYTNHRGHASELALNAARSGFDLIVAVGGDGTVNEVARSLAGTEMTMGIIPRGSGNGLARELGIPMSLKKSVQTLINGKPKIIDVCAVNEQHYLCTAGLGFDARVADQMARAHKRGFWRYIQITISESLSFKPFQVKMEVDGKLIDQPVFLVTFANARQFGNNAFIAPKADISDGLIDVVVVKPFPKILLPVFGIGLFAGYIPKLPFVDNYKAKKVVIHSAETGIYHFDGEPGKISYPAEISIEPQRLSIIQPRNA
ncbi:MAG: diacylglycerol kinase family protein [Draconibacterium sp.]